MRARETSNEANSSPTRSEKDDSDSGGDDKIGAILMAREAHGRICRNFDRRVVARVGSDDDYFGGVV